MSGSPRSMEDDAAAHLPGLLERSRHVELQGRGHAPLLRRTIVALLAAFSLCALANLFGQRSAVSSAQGAQASFVVRVPHTVRSGLFFQGRIDIVARRHMHQPTLMLGNGWAEQMQIDTIEPSPAQETSSDGRLELTYAPLATGDHLTVWMQFEVNPTGAGRRDQSVALLDGNTPVASTRAAIRVLP